ncbi:Phosphatidate cytidylyltransferase [Rubripirellula lacrimiformis]|uniref:Phosphatidate cytidylyltransferase n=1 Tax=Rubripirellula lacrimiformis TaxID=1930273 RepID=A0A517NGG9_9BACT|nr:phosphatidate cytidylyltransferase [Rubripirellula lacrimiformis]QDT06229.1 Phosphatidate cytidylyltransferase [Rubripirellula lacrimiformis]
MLIDRLRTSAVLILVVAALLHADAHWSMPGCEGLWLLPLLFFFALGTTADLCGLLAASGHDVARRDTMIATGLVTGAAAIPLAWPIFGATYPADCPVGRLGWIVIAGVGATFLILIAEMNRYAAGKKGTIERTSAAIFMSLYVGLPMALLVSLRMMGSGNWGLAALLTMIATTKSADAGAYFSGKAFGKHKLVPRLSPGKTRQGAVGGIVTATIVAFACLQWLFPLIADGASGPVSAPSIPGLDTSIGGALLLGPLLAIAGMIGDLAESLIKRAAGAKDSGSLLPGLGGVWDVTDSLIAAVMPAFLCFAAGVGS